MCSSRARAQHHIQQLQQIQQRPAGGHKHSCSVGRATTGGAQDPVRLITDRLEEEEEESGTSLSHQVLVGL
ncbi:hypothetical protein CgunFtcFv8_014839 [Champsocephalus gunnari]|uniref:Uncharacterized protein n=1 Tax=Champsocephalus gunnari TaxID=52237 RepID=A0AAN8E6U5_CHAGU|nr:hypothetical protein CgunFtcFv8_014839 [Champsocephalus gunnari]